MRDDLTARQQRIFEGLNAIGQEIAGFYKAGLAIYPGTFPNGAYLLLHAAREIDAGLRDILAVDYSPEDKEEGRHKKSILFSLGAADLEGLAKDWFAATKELHRYAHRRGAWKSPREMEEVRPLWDRFETVLERLVGSYYALIERIERIGKIRNIEGGVLETLSNILTIPTYYNYFFRSEKNPKWFGPLKEKGFFSPNQIKFDEQNNAFFWNVLNYLERVSEQVDQNPQIGKELINIIDGIVRFSESRKRINNDHIWWYCVKILNNIPISIILDSLSLENFRQWLSVWTVHTPGNDLVIGDIGEKLLPKLLNDTLSVKYAEAIIETITRVKAEERSSVSITWPDAVLAWHSYWVRDAFRKNHQLIGQRCSINTLLTIAGQLRKALEYEANRHHSNIRISEDAYRIEVSRTSAKETNAKIIEFEEGQYNCVVKQFSQNQLKEIESDNETGDFYLYNTEPQVELQQFTFKAFNTNDFIQTIRENLSLIIDLANVKDFERHMVNIFDGLHCDYSYIWCHSVAQGPEYGDNAKEVLTVALRDVLLAKCEASREQGEQVLKAFLNDKYLFSIFRRFVLLCVDKFWTDYAHVFGKFLDVNSNAFEESDFEFELQDVLRNHNSDFSDSLKEQLLKIINDNVPEYYIKEGEKLIAYWKYKWLSPLRENPEFSPLYKAAKEKAKPKDGKPYKVEPSIKGGSVEHKSPLSKEDILQKPIPELVAFLNNFQGADFWCGTFESEPDKKGLGESLQIAIKEDPNKFTDEINAFVNIGYFYLHQIFSGFEKAWKDGKDIDWAKIFEFSIKYFERGKDIIIKEALQDQGEDSGEGKYIWIVDDIVDLIADGCRDDKRAFDPQYLDKAEKIFELILPLLKGEKHPDTQRDALTYAMNTTLGRSVQGSVSLALRKARVTQKLEENWGRKRYEPFFDIGIEAHIWFGFYLPQMKYLDGEYAKKKIEDYSKKGSLDFEWVRFMEGYLQGTLVYPEVYALMRTNYAKALESRIFVEQVDQRLVEHISLGYLHYGEKLEGPKTDGTPSLFWEMLSEASVLNQKDRWLKVARFFWSHTGRVMKEGKEEKETSETIKMRIIEFWAWTFNEKDFVKNILGDDYHAFLSQVAELTILLDKIDEEKEKWLVLSAPYVNLHHNAMSFIEYLAKFEDDESIKRIGKIFLKMIENTTPTFMQEHIELIVRRIYDKGDRSDADAICNTFGRRGVHFLKPLWVEYNSV
jgi:hypothetical protein